MREQAEIVSPQSPTTTPFDDLRAYGFESVDDDDYESDSIDELLIHLKGDARPFVEVEIFNKKLIGLLDSGAQRTVPL